MNSNNEIGAELKGNWRTHFGYKYLSSEDFEDGQESKLTISKVTKDEAINPRTKESKTGIVVWFKETSRPLFLNATNAKSIVKLSGSPKVNKWIGQTITLYKAHINAFGNPKKPCIRIK